MTIDTITKSPTPTELVKKVNELVEGLNDGRASSIPVGHVYTVGYSELDAGQLPLLGGEYSRTSYADLWAWVQSKPSMLKSEAQWQTLNSASSYKGVPYYSAGNGTTTFRVPLFGCYVKGSTNIGDVCGFLAAGLPNAVGAYSGNIGEDGSNASGAFSVANQRPHGAWQGAITMNRLNDIYLSLAKSNPIFGNSDTVQPDSIIQLYVVQAFGEVTNVGSTDVAAIAVGLQEVETNKANADFSNVSQTAKNLSIGWGMPDYSAGVSFSASTNYKTAPTNILVMGIILHPGGTATWKIGVKGSELESTISAGLGVPFNFIARAGDQFIVTGTAVFTQLRYYPFLGGV